MPKVSIIMPIFNAENYLGEAIESVLRQTYSNFELFLINDRSTDRSKEICVEYCKKDDRIVLLENDTDSHGPGPTRNIGLDQANGEYIYFMDADDWIEENLLQCAIHHMKETDADIVQFGALFERENQEFAEVYGELKKGSLTRDDIKRDFISFLRGMSTCLWLCLFRQEVVKSVRFEDNMCGEDASYIVDVLQNTNKIAYLEKALYHYRYIEGSTLNSWHQDLIDSHITNWNHFKDYMDSFQGGIDPQAYTEAAYENYLWAMYHLCKSKCPLSYGERKRELERLRKGINFDQYRHAYQINSRQGMDKLKYLLVKWRLDNFILLFGPLFMKIVRGA